MDEQTLSVPLASLIPIDADSNKDDVQSDDSTVCDAPYISGKGLELAGPRSSLKGIGGELVQVPMRVLNKDLYTNIVPAVMPADASSAITTILAAVRNPSTIGTRGSILPQFTMDHKNWLALQLHVDPVILVSKYEQNALQHCRYKYDLQMFMITQHALLSILSFYLFITFSVLSTGKNAMS